MNAEYWKNEQVGDPHGPQKYQELQPESYPMLEAILALTDEDSFILDLGCNQGRHMKALLDRSRPYVTGVDVKPFDDPMIMCDTFEHWLPLQGDGCYDVVFSFGMTVELVLYDFPINHHLARIARRAVILCIQETGIPYPRDWKAEYLAEGFTCTRYDKPVTPGSNANLLVFERI
jgi:hypothetical protein